MRPTSAQEAQTMKDELVGIKWDEYQKWYRRKTGYIPFFKSDSIYQVIRVDNTCTYLEECDPITGEFSGIFGLVPHRFIIPLK
jgi:hypothetical protein